MTITREQLADLQPGDVVEARRIYWPEGQVVRGPVSRDGNALVVAEFVVGWTDAAALDDDKIITVVSRAPRPLYVNHPRTKPVWGDVVRDGDGITRHALPYPADDGDPSMPRWWGSIPEFDGEWLHSATSSLTRPLTLLVDGETGQVVP